MSYLHRSINLTTVKRVTKESIKVAFLTTLWNASLWVDVGANRLNFSYLKKIT